MEAASAKEDYMAPSVYYDERSVAFFKAYKKALSRKDIHSHNEALLAAISSPADRFWVSVFQAYRYVLLYKKGVMPSSASKRKLVSDLYIEYERLAGRSMFSGCSTFFIVQFAVGMPAPEFYMSYRTARRIIERMRHDKRQNK